MARSPRFALATFLLSVAGLVATPITFALGDSPTNTGVVPRVGSPVRPIVWGTPVWQVEPRLGTFIRMNAVPDIGVHRATLADQPSPPQGPRPLRIRVNAVGIDARIVSVGVQGNGEMQVPDDISTVGWYRFGSRPGRPGSAVLSGHVDSRLAGAGAFFRLQDVKPGDVVVVNFSDGSVRSFRAVARRSFPKARLPGTLFARRGPAVLALITCGGEYDARTHHYADNVVVYAVPQR